LQSIKDKQGIKALTNKQISITVNRNNKVKDYLNKAAIYLINWCRKNRISTLVVGVNPGMKQNINLGKKNNQKFVQIPHHNLRMKLKAMCDRYGLTYKEQEESYTSKASFLDGDLIPIYNTIQVNILSVVNELSDAAPPKRVSPMSDCLYDSVVCTKLGKEN